MAHGVGSCNCPWTGRLGVASVGLLFSFTPLQGFRAYLVDPKTYCFKGSTL